MVEEKAWHMGPAPMGANSATGSSSDKNKCTYCGKTNHKVAQCYVKKNTAGGNIQGKSTNAALPVKPILCPACNQQHVLPAHFS